MRNYFSSKLPESRSVFRSFFETLKYIFLWEKFYSVFRLMRLMQGILYIHGMLFIIIRMWGKGRTKVFRESTYFRFIRFCPHIVHFYIEWLIRMFWKFFLVYTVISRSLLFNDCGRSLKWFLYWLILFFNSVYNLI